MLIASKVEMSDIDVVSYFQSNHMKLSDKRLLSRALIVILLIVYIQVLLGGITRLTESGLSMTNWKPITGVLPPLNTAEWQAEFELYRQSPQYLEINKGMELAEFKKIFFWEWLHRLWGRVGFLALLLTGIWFTLRKKLDMTAIKRFGLLLFLYLCQGLLGWIMVKSGLVSRPEVSHYRLTAHLLLAIFLFAYLLWWISDLLVPYEQKFRTPGLLRFARWVIVLTILQIMFGGFMSGLEAATHYPTFPDMNGGYLPEGLFRMEPFWINFFENITTIQFTHRGIAYLLAVLILIFWFKSRNIITGANPTARALMLLPLVLLAQFTLGVLVLLNAQGTVPVGLGVAHQGVGLFLLSVLLFISFGMAKSGRYG